MNLSAIMNPIDEEGQSNRMKLQVNFLNLGVNWSRFFARILLYDIPDRRKAKSVEKEHIRNYKDLNGRRPRGNLED